MAEGENRVALTPDVIKKLVDKAEVFVQTGAGARAGFPDSSFKAAGAKIVKSIEDIFAADLLISVNLLSTKVTELKKLFANVKPQTSYIAQLSALSKPEQFDIYKAAKMSVMSMELIPRISRAQSMDILSSQANLAGYRAVIEAVYEYGRSMPMMMTAAGTVAPAKVMILGAGVAGLQAIATARRLGAVVSAFDVRAAAREQVESLGAKFIAVEAEADGEDKGGYAKEMSKEYQKKQAEKIMETLRSTDIAITTALIPGKQAPVLITADMVKQMRPGSVIVDMATSQGGNCQGSQLDKIVEVEGVKIIGYSNLASRLAQDTSVLFAKNVANFLNLCWDETKKTFDFSKDDEIIKAITILDQGKYVHPAFIAPKKA